MKGQGLHHHSCRVPSVGAMPRLVLDMNVCTDIEWGNSLCMLRPAFVRLGVFVAECFFPDIQVLGPHLMQVEFPWQDGDEVFYWSAEDTHGRRHPSGWVWRISVV